MPTLDNLRIRKPQVEHQLTNGLSKEDRDQIEGELTKEKWPQRGTCAGTIEGPIQIARQGSGYPSSCSIEAGKNGSVCALVDSAKLSLRRGSAETPKGCRPRQGPSGKCPKR